MRETRRNADDAARYDEVTEHAESADVQNADGPITLCISLVSALG